MNDLQNLLNKNHKICKLSTCNQTAELEVKDKSTSILQLNKQKEFICYSYQVEVKNGYCQYHNRFIDHRTLKIKKR